MREQDRVEQDQRVFADAVIDAETWIEQAQLIKSSNANDKYKRGELLRWHTDFKGRNRVPPFFSGGRHALKEGVMWETAHLLLVRSKLTPN